MSQVFPAPVIVVGVGRFGLAVLERLGDDWMGLRLSGADVSVANLRLLSVRPGSADARNGGSDAPGEPESNGSGAPAGWRPSERDAVRIASYLGDSDLPSLALDFTILRSLGLVRYHDGSYQVALPRDAGVVEVEVPVEVGAGLDEELETAADAEPGGQIEKHIHRRRYFDWLRLDPDPIMAAERLRYLAQRIEDVDLFVTPLLNRVRQGHSPHTLLACIDRCRALVEGRDPAPWEWLSAAEGEPPAEGWTVPVSGLLDAEEVADAKRIETFLEEGVTAIPEPLPGWRRWIQGSDAVEEPRLVVPSIFLRRTDDLTSPLAPVDLLDQDWETTGWASERRRATGEVFATVTPHPLRLGLFDHDFREGVSHETVRLLAGRLHELGKHLHRGLVRLWVDLQRERVGDPNVNVLEQARQRDELSDALRQSLEVLGEILVRPLTRDGDPEIAARIEGVSRLDGSAAELDLPSEPSRFLAGLQVETSADTSPLHTLENRLARLGFEQPGGTGERSRERPLCEDVRLAVGPHGMETEAAAHRILTPLRQALNRQVRQLYELTFLALYRNRPTRQPPRLTVFVIGEMSEAFTREAMRHVLREMHAELLRAFTPIFESYREGFDRSLCVTPILWMPHPADPFQGESLEVSRCEEAAIIDAVHGIRRWVECVLPPGRRCISQIFVNSRVTDTAALSLADAVRQTRDFLSFQIRNDLGRDHWLRQTATGTSGGDLFSSFSCYEIDFPALRSREYLANRLARGCLAALKQGEEKRKIDDPEPLKPPTLEELAKDARTVLGSATRQAGESLALRVRERVPLTSSTPACEVLSAFDQRFGHELKAEVWARWSDLTGRQGRVDDLVDDLRLDTSRLLGQAVCRLRSYSDHLIEDYAGTGGGLKAAQAGFHKLRQSTRDMFQAQETLRRSREVLCQRHEIPDLEPLGSARRSVLRAAERKPDLYPIRLGLSVWALLSLVLGAPLSHAVAYFFELHLRPNLFELLLGPGGALVGGLALWLPAWALLRWHARRRLRELAAAVERMAEEAHALLWGIGLPPEQEPRPSVRSFLESRLELTGAVSTRGFSLSVLERALADLSLFHRLTRSVDVQCMALARKSEDLGVRATMVNGSEGKEKEDLRGLFEGRSRVPADRLIDPQSLHGYYRRRIGEDLSREVPALVVAAGGFSAWREQACLADTEQLLGHCRGRFDNLVREPISDQHFFGTEVGPRLIRFVARYYSNLGFGAGFKGYEGLDPDNVQVLAEVTLILHEGLESLFEKTRREQRNEVATTETMDVKYAKVRPNAAYMLSLVQGIRVHSLRNLRRFESFHNRLTMPDDRIFPLSHEPRAVKAAVNPLTGFEEIGRDLAIAALPLPSDHD